MAEKARKIEELSEVEEPGPNSTKTGQRKKRNQTGPEKKNRTGPVQQMDRFP